MEEGHPPPRRKVYIETVGCQMNLLDSELVVGRLRGGLNVVMVLSMVIFSGISGSKMADVAAVGSVLIPAARRSRQNPGDAVALLAASAVMAETIPPCINLIILGFVANLSIGGLFAAVGAALIVAAVARYLLHAPALGWSQAAGFGVVVGVAAQLGDLMESMIKRDCARKDASAVVPGFGGVLDVLDSLLFAAPVAFGYWLCLGP